MPDLNASDVQTYTKGRLASSDNLTTVLLKAALAGARSVCGWHVNPVKENHVLTLDGSGSELLLLPTLKVVELKAVTEDGKSLDLADVMHSAGGPVRLRKVTGRCWTPKYSAVTVTMDHGYDDEAAADWRLAVLDAVDRFSESIGATGLKRYRVDDVDREWFNNPDAFNRHLIAPYRLMP